MRPGHWLGSVHRVSSVLGRCSLGDSEGMGPVNICATYPPNVLFGNKWMTKRESSNPHSHGKWPSQWRQVVACGFQNLQEKLWLLPEQSVHANYPS